MVMNSTSKLYKNIYTVRNKIFLSFLTESSQLSGNVDKVRIKSSVCKRENKLNQ